MFAQAAQAFAKTRLANKPHRGSSVDETHVRSSVIEMRGQGGEGGVGGGGIRREEDEWIEEGGKEGGGQCKEKKEVGLQL